MKATLWIWIIKINLTTSVANLSKDEWMPNLKKKV